MDEISKLLKEAKPLYLKEKRNKRNAKIALSGILLIFLSAGGIFEITNINSQNMLAQYDISIIEEVGLPVDEYGFLMVE